MLPWIWRTSMPNRLLLMKRWEITFEEIVIEFNIENIFKILKLYISKTCMVIFNLFWYTCRYRWMFKLSLSPWNLHWSDQLLYVQLFPRIHWERMWNRYQTVRWRTKLQLNNRFLNDSIAILVYPISYMKLLFTIEITFVILIKHIRFVRENGFNPPQKHPISQKRLSIFHTATKNDKKT